MPDLCIHNLPSLCELDSDLVQNFFRFSTMVFEALVMVNRWLVVMHRG